MTYSKRQSQKIAKIGDKKAIGVSKNILINCTELAENYKKTLPIENYYLEGVIKKNGELVDVWSSNIEPLFIIVVWYSLVDTLSQFGWLNC